METLYRLQFHWDRGCTAVLLLFIVWAVYFFILTGYMRLLKADENVKFFGTDEKTIINKLAPNPEKRKVRAVTGFIFVFIVFLLVFSCEMINFLNLYGKFYSGNYKTVEGVVTNLEYNETTRTERFSVNDVKFAYRENGRRGYNITSVNGGCVEEGKKLSIDYIPGKRVNVIVGIRGEKTE